MEHKWKSFAVFPTDLADIRVWYKDRKDLPVYSMWARVIEINSSLNVEISMRGSVVFNKPGKDELWMYEEEFQEFLNTAFVPETTTRRKSKITLTP